MSEIKDLISSEEFNAAINGDKPVLVDFFASRCGPSKMQTPILYEFKEDLGDKVEVVKVDVDQNGEVAAKYGVESIPTLAVFVGGELKEKKVGLTTKAGLSEMLIKYL